MVINAKQEQHADFRKPLSRSANERITDGHVLRLAYVPTGVHDAARDGDANFRVSSSSKYKGTTAAIFIEWLPSYSAKERP